MRRMKFLAVAMAALSTLVASQPNKEAKAEPISIVMVEEPTETGPISEVEVVIEEPELPLKENDQRILAKLLYGEANDYVPDVERAMVIWCVFNRLDNGEFGATVEEVVVDSGEFEGYNEYYPITNQNLSLVRDILARWQKEKAGQQNIGRTLPKDYLFFMADGTGRHNKFYKWSSGGLGIAGDYRIWYDYQNPVENPYI